MNERGLLQIWPLPAPLVWPHRLLLYNSTLNELMEVIKKRYIAEFLREHPIDTNL